MPDEAPTVAILVAPLVHVPPATELDKVVLWVAQTESEPEKVPGDGLTVTTRVTVLPPNE